MAADLLSVSLSKVFVPQSARLQPLERNLVCLHTPTGSQVCSSWVAQMSRPFASDPARQWITVGPADVVALGERIQPGDLLERAYLNGFMTGRRLHGEGPWCACK